MTPITPLDIIRMCSSSNPLAQRAARTLLERLKHALDRHTHITFTDWTSGQKNSPGPNHRTLITACIRLANATPDSPFIHIIISIKDTGQVHYHLAQNTVYVAQSVPLANMEPIDPINQPNDTKGFVAHVLDSIRTHIAPLPNANGYFI